MRTRRSPKNQDRLFWDLSGKYPVITPTSTVSRCWDCWSYPPGGRGRGECVLIGQMVNGRNEGRKCFRKRGTMAPLKAASRGDRK